MNATYLCLGGNLGDRVQHLERAIALISDSIAPPKAISAFYESEAWGIDHAPDYLNLCLYLETTLEAPELLEVLQGIELLLGRVRHAEERNASRTLDIDILFYNRDILDLPHLQIPHPRLHLRRFVLLPLCDIAPELVHPILKKNIQALLHECPDTLGVRPFQP